MRHFLLCGLVLALDVAFALSGAKAFVAPAFSETWAGVPVSVWAGIAGIVVLAVVTLAISLLAFRVRRS